MRRIVRLNYETREPAFLLGWHDDAELPMVLKNADEPNIRDDYSILRVLRACIWISGLDSENAFFNHLPFVKHRRGPLAINSEVRRSKRGIS